MTKQIDINWQHDFSVNTSISFIERFICEPGAENMVINQQNKDNKLFITVDTDLEAKFPNIHRVFPSS